MTGTILVLNGPNLNLLGKREPGIYGAETLDDVAARCRTRADSLGYAVDFRQSNHEGVLIDAIHEARESHVAIVINGGAFSHTSIAIRDALATVEAPVIEVHISNIHAREPFRHHSFSATVATGMIAGLGTLGYELAIEAIAARLSHAASPAT